MTGPVDLGSFAAINEHHGGPLGALIEAWRAHLARLESELALPSSDSTWGADDVVAALILRDAIERTMSKGSAAEQREILRVLDPVDNLYKSISERDDFATIQHFAGESNRTGWWWRRILTGGPSRVELDLWLESRSEWLGSN